MIVTALSLLALAGAPRKTTTPRLPPEAPAVGSTLQAPLSPVGSTTDGSTTSDTLMMEPTEFVDQDIRDVLRAIARAYNLNIFPNPEVRGKVTVTLHRMPVMDALRLIVQQLGYELSWENSAWVVGPRQMRSQGAIEMGRGSISLSFRNKDLQEFADEYARRTGLNILVDRNAKGTISGTLRAVEPIDGLKAILTANGFEVRGQGDAWIITTLDAAPASGRSMGGPGRNRVDLQVRRGLVTANLRQAMINDVVQTIADQSGYNMITYGQLGGTVDANLRDVPLFQALSLILQGTPFTYALQDSVLLIGDRNPGSASGQALSKNEIYYLRHTRVDKVLPLLPKNLPPQAMQAVPELNALLLSGTGEMNEKVKEFLVTIDQPIPQVVIEAVIVEFYRGRNTQHGIKAGQSKSEVATTDVVGPAIALQGGIAMDPSQLLKTSMGDLTTTVGLLPQNFLLQLEAIENSDKGRVLARPRLTTLNGQAANINVGTSDYFQVTTTDRNGVISSDYRAFNTGITLSITPYLTKSGQITAEIKPEVRTPRSTSGSSADDSRPPGTSTRSLQTNVSLKDGETIVLGGLMQTLDLENIQGVPLLSAIPILGKLFTYHTRNRETTELAIFITPHVLQTGDSIPLDPKAVIEEMDKRVNGMRWNPLAKEDLLPSTPEEAARPSPSPKPPIPEAPSITAPATRSDSSSARTISPIQVPRSNDPEHPEGLR